MRTQHAGAAIMAACVALAAPVASACLPSPPLELVSYASGDLFNEIARNAEVIQIARAAVGERIETEWSSRRGPVHNFELRPTDTLGSVPMFRAGLRITIPAHLRTEASQDDRNNDPLFYQFLDSAASRPIQYWLVEPIPRPCFMTTPTMIDGDYFIVLRRGDGRLYERDRIEEHDLRYFSLRVDTRIPYTPRSPQHWTPSVMRIAGPDDPAIERLREAIAAQALHRQAMARRVLIDRGAEFLFGRSIASSRRAN